MRRSEYCFSCLVTNLIVASCFMLPALQLSADNRLNIDKNLASSYLYHAKNAYNLHQYDAAASILQESRAFVVDNSDYHALNALLNIQENKYRRATSELELALKNYETERLFSKSDLVSEIIPLYYRLKNYSAIVKLYEERPDHDYPQVAFYYLLALRRLDRQEDLMKQANNLFLKYPNDCRLYFALLNLPEMSSRYLDIFRVLSRERERQLLNSIERSIFLASIKSIEDIDQRRDLLNIGYQWLQDDENYHIYAAKNDLLLPTIDRILLPSLFQEFNEDSIDDYSRLITEGATLKLGIDTDLDGFPDEIAQLSNDKSYWLYSRMYDNNYYYKINMVKGLILSVEERRGDQRVVWEFSSYPTVKQATISTTLYPEGRTVRYHLLPQKISIDTAQSRRIINGWTPIPSLNSKSTLPQENSLLLASYQLDEYNAERLFRTMTIKLGQVSSIMEDSTGDGYFDHMMAIKDWKVVYGRRDVGRRGKFDLYEYYQDGVWQGLAYAPDGDGHISYYEDWQESPIKLWDFNRDSFIDGYSLTPPNSTEVTIEPHSLTLLKAEDFLPWDFSTEGGWFNE